MLHTDHTVYSKKIYRKTWFWGILTYSSVFRKLAGKPVSDIATSSIMLCHASRLFPLAASPAQRLGLLVCGVRAQSCSSFCCRSSNHNAPPLATPRSMTNGLTLTGVEHRSTRAHQIPHLPASMMTWQMMFDFVTQDESSSKNIAFCALFRLKRDRWIHESQAQQSKRT